MNGGEFLALSIIALSCGTGTVITYIRHAFTARHRQAQLEAQLAQERVRILEAQLMESHRQNDQLTKQLEWHTKMLETQDKLMNRLTDSSRLAESAVGSSR